MKTYEIRCRENGDYITYFDTLEEAEAVLEKFAQEDMREEMPEWKSKEWEEFMNTHSIEEYRDFYEIVEVDFAEQLRELINKSGLSQKAFAQKMDIPLRTIESWIGGQREPNAFTQKAVIEQASKISE